MSNFQRFPQLYSLRSNAMTYFRRTPVAHRHRDRLISSTVGTVSPLIGFDIINQASTTIYRHRGRMPGARNIGSGNWTWIENYVIPNSIYTDQMFARRFGIPKLCSNDFQMIFATLLHISGGL